MTPKTRLFLSAATAFSMMIPAASASAQRMPVGGSSSNRDADENSRPQGEKLPDAIPGSGAEGDPEGRKYAVSKGAQKSILALQEAVNANKQAEVPGLVQAALGKAKTADDKYIIGANQARAGVAAQNYDQVMAGYDLMNESGAASASNLSARYANLGQTFMKANQNDQALAALDKAITLDANNAPALALKADLMSKQGQKAEAVDLMARSLAASVANGKTPAEGNFMFAAGLAYEQRSPKANEIAMQWIKAYPSSKSWRDGLRIYRDLARPDGPALLDLMRLAHAADALAGEADYHLYLVNLAKDGRMAEGAIVLGDAGDDPDVDTQKQAFVDVKKMLGKAPGRAAIDAAAAKAKGGSDAAAMIAAGDDLYGAGAYAEAADLYRAAAAAGADANLANLRLGMALARAGDKSGAKTALAAVSGDNEQLAKFWMLWVDTQA